MDCKGQNQYQGVFLPVSPELSSPSPDAFLLLLISPGLCFQIPDKQYVLTALAARAKLRAWHDVDALFTTKVGALGLSALQWRCRLAIPRLLGVSGFTPYLRQSATRSIGGSERQEPSGSYFHIDVLVIS